MPHLEDHYRDLSEQQGYDPIDFDLGPLPAAQLQRKFAAVDGHDIVAAALERPTIISTGIGMTGPPHMGSLGQILTAITLQEAGLDVQFVLADLEVYHGGGELDELRDLAGRYRSFILDLGFDPDKGTLRTQEEAQDVMHSAQLLARYYTPDKGQYWPDVEPTRWEKAVRDSYESASDSGDTQSPTSKTGDLHSALLHGTDFLHPLMKWEYEQVIIMLGIDEHKLTIGTQQFQEDAGVDGTIAGLHTKLIKGVNGYPKMSKSLPESVISLDMDSDAIRDRIQSPGDSYNRPRESVVFQMMCLASTYSMPELDELHEYCAEGGAAWEQAKEEYADYVVELAEMWGCQ